MSDIVVLSNLFLSVATTKLGVVSLPKSVILRSKFSEIST